jgi:hypothetical protein
LNGRIIDGFGYVRIWKPDHPDATKTGYILEHRLVMEKKIGKRLRKGEVVHHINHNKTDNRQENLWLFEDSSHGRYEASRQWRNNLDRFGILTRI